MDNRPNGDSAVPAPPSRSINASSKRGAVSATCSGGMSPCCDFLNARSFSGSDAPIALITPSLNCDSFSARCSSGGCSPAGWRPEAAPGHGLRQRCRLPLISSLPSFISSTSRHVPLHRDRRCSTGSACRRRPARAPSAIARGARIGRRRPGSSSSSTSDRPPGYRRGPALLHPPKASCQPFG
ncbi:Uncharacterised protein [Klebsiella pneumoniae]|nr:Uncharacterised protein [Klebsiella pneumoniae]